MLLIVIHDWCYEFKYKIQITIHNYIHVADLINDANYTSYVKCNRVGVILIDSYLYIMMLNIFSDENLIGSQFIIKDDNPASP